jgi:hypothetical protein
MTNWGYGLFVGFIALGLTKRVKWRKASRLTMIVAAIVMVGVFASYHGLR